MKTFYNMQENRIPIIIDDEQEYMRWAIDTLFFIPPPANDFWEFEIPHSLDLVR